MSIFRCKMCGGNIEFEQGASVGTCDHCGTKQTLPKTDDDMIANLFNRANNLRLKCEFDKAEQIYEKIVQQDDGEAEAHWGIVLCKYGIEYVEDPKTHQRIPTCHRTLFEAVTADPDYVAAVDYSDAQQQVIYESEARAIDRIQRDILAIVKNEKPFDVFICYKETDENGKRTIDSAIANDIYYQLTQEGLKVFYAAITLEEKLGQEYEPYIFAALNSAKVMLVIGTKPEHFNAVWVKNEWSRYLRLMKTDRSKLLIPCYRDMDAYDLPEEFAHLQAQDMSKIGFINDVVRGIKRVIQLAVAKVPVVTPVATAPTSHIEISPLLKRIELFLEDGEFDRADDFCEQVLNIDPTNADAYIFKLLVEYKCHSKNTLSSLWHSIKESKNFAKVIRFGTDEQKAYIQNAENVIQVRIKGIAEEEARRKKAEEEERQIYGQYKAEKLKTAKVGDYVVFGSYEQDNNTSNGKEDIEWLVLAKEGDKALVISRYALDCQQYNTSYKDVTWKTCSLRKWLNGTFISNAFSWDELSMIKTTTVAADKNPSFSTSPGNNTNDKVFLLSISEVNKYFSSDEARKCAPTKYAKARGAGTSSSYSVGGNATCWWWLRSPGNGSYHAANVYLDGSVFSVGISVSFGYNGVRPAMWITISE